jgi:hypothetical protein
MKVVKRDISKSITFIDISNLIPKVINREITFNNEEEGYIKPENAGTDLPCIKIGKTLVWLNQSKKYHNLSGPSIIYEDNQKEYWINGIFYEKELWETVSLEIKLNNIKNL